MISTQRTMAVSDLSNLEEAYSMAREQYAAIGVDTDKALERLGKIPISIHCWQGDDVAGFEATKQSLDGGLAVTGNYPGKATTPAELRQDFEQAMSLIPGNHRFNLHAIYADTGGRQVERNQLEPEHFQTWIDWAKEHHLALDFNPSCFSHAKSADGMTLSHHDTAIRQFWVEHVICCRRIGASFGEALGTTCINNIWVPDGSKDTPIDRKAPRERLAESLDNIFAETIDPHYLLDSVEAKLFGIGSESYVVGSHEFYLGYAIRNGVMICMDTGHYHPTEIVSDKISAVLSSVDRMLLHISRGVRWDSDHVATYTDELQALAQELVRGNYLDRVHIGLDFFDGSINRVAAWIIGTRAMIKALLNALLEPTEALRNFEIQGDYTARLAWLEDLKQMPLGAVWNYYCLTSGVSGGGAWLKEVKRYEAEVLSCR